MDIKKIGIFISEKRREHNMTQQQLADKLCVTVQAVSKWECGKGMPDISLLQPLCEALDISVSELLSGEVIPPSERLEQSEKRILELWGQLFPKHVPRFRLFGFRIFNFGGRFRKDK